MLVHLLVLNYNGRPLLRQCLPSIVRAARASCHRCTLTVIDNDSTDDSVVWLRDHWPHVPVIRCSNLGLCSFNDVVAGLEGHVAVLLNNDVKLHERCIDPLVAPLQLEDSCFMTAPKCRLFDAVTYEGFKTAVRWRWGLVQATARYPGHETTIDQPGLTASAGAVLAVDREKFVELGGFDPLYLPGRLEDLDLAFRAYQCGYHARYVPEALAWHRGMATFESVLGSAGCDRIALRNTLLFQWKNLRHPNNVARQVAAFPLRLALDLVRAPVTSSQRRWVFIRALFGALSRIGQLRCSAYRGLGDTRGERVFFRKFHPQQMATTST